MKRFILAASLFAGSAQAELNSVVIDLPYAQDTSILLPLCESIKTNFAERLKQSLAAANVVSSCFVNELGGYLAFMFDGPGQIYAVMDRESTLGLRRFRLNTIERTVAFSKWVASGLERRLAPVTYEIKVSSFEEYSFANVEECRERLPELAAGYQAKAGVVFASDCADMGPEGIILVHGILCSDLQCYGQLWIDRSGTAEPAPVP
jgi:hypothetical protein